MQIPTADIAAFLRTGGAPQGAGCIACDRNVRGGVLRSSHLRPSGDEGARIGVKKGRAGRGENEKKTK